MKILFKVILNVLAIGVVTILVITAVRYKRTHSYTVFRQRIAKPFSGIQKVIDAKKSNLKIELSPSRVKPLTSIEQEENLRMYMPDIFASFTQKEWSEFWSIIYYPIEEKKDGVKRKRYREREEIENEFIDRYGKSFTYLRRDDWTTFWTHIVKVSW